MEEELLLLLAGRWRSGGAGGLSARDSSALGARAARPSFPCPADHAKLCKLLDTYEKAFIVGADNVGSQQFQDIRKVRAGAVHARSSAARAGAAAARRLATPTRERRAGA